MAKFHGIVGYGSTEEIRPGVWDDVITETQYFGDVVRQARSSRSDPSTVLNDISLSNQISIMADAYAFGNFFNIRFVVWNGVAWTVPSVEVNRPRLILSMGEVYNGPRQSA
jgi:hypothetical protein